MIAGHARGAMRVGVLARDREGPPARRPWAEGAVALQLGADASANHLRDRDPEALRAAFDLPVLGRFKLYLKSHHDGISIPS